MALNFELRRDKHAIGEFSAVLGFSGPVSMNAFARVIERLKQVAKDMDLPAQMNVQMFSIAGGSPSVTAPLPGLGFQRFAGNGEVACSLWCDNNSITMTLRDYDRWHNVLPKLVTAFSAIAPEYMSEIPAFSSFHVQYINEFASKNSVEMPASEIFRPNSAWIAPFFAESKEAWHCHVGQFIPSDEQSRFLLNINCDVAPSPHPPTADTRNFVKVLILASRQYDIPGRGPLVISSDQISSVLKDNFNIVHSFEKKTLVELISDEYLDVMGDGSRDH